MLKQSSLGRKRVHAVLLPAKRQHYHFIQLFVGRTNENFQPDHPSLDARQDRCSLGFLNDIVPNSFPNFQALDAWTDMSVSFD